MLDGDAEEPRSKLLRYGITVLVFVLLLSGVVAYLLRYHTEKGTVEHFLNTLAAGDLQQAYRLWKPNPSYSYEDFLRDWGPTGEFGPVKSYRLETAQRPRDGSGIVIVVEVSKFQPFPSEGDFEKDRQNKEVRLWVERKDQSISFAQ